VKGGSAALDAHVSALKDDLHDLSDFESRARDLCDRLAVGLQAASLFRAGSPIADAFCRSRIETRGAHNYGALTGVDAKAIVKGRRRDKVTAAHPALSGPSGERDGVLTIVESN
jgi:putative acyl-CoA dehydrogenase